MSVVDIGTYKGQTAGRTGAEIRADLESRLNLSGRKKVAMDRLPEAMPRMLAATSSAPSDKEFQPFGASGMPELPESARVQTKLLGELLAKLNLAPHKADTNKQPVMAESTSLHLVPHATPAAPKREAETQIPAA